jgi:hypothetical protein
MFLEFKMTKFSKQISKLLNSVSYKYRVMLKLDKSKTRFEQFIIVTMLTKSDTIWSREINMNIYNQFKEQQIIAQYIFGI